MTIRASDVGAGHDNLDPGGFWGNSTAEVAKVDADEKSQPIEEKSESKVLDSGYTLLQYMIDSSETAIYPEAGQSSLVGLSYLFLKLNGEAGEVAEKFAKIIRDKGGVGTEEDRQELIKEVGDVLWYLAQISNELFVGLDEVARLNIEKLRSRKERGVLGGSGDNR